MISLHYFIALLFYLTISSKSISSIPFQRNPGCDLKECEDLTYPAIFYANHYLDDSTIHVLYSSLDDLTISIIQTKKGYGPHFDYTALYKHNYPGSISFGDTTPLNSFSLIIRRLMKFDDQNDTGDLGKNENSIKSYWLKGLTSNFTNNTNQPSFQLPLDQINGLLTIDIDYPGDFVRDEKFPKLRSTPKSYFLNIALKADNFTSPKTRFAMEYYLIQLGVEGTQLQSSRYIDDQFTPGIFNVWEIKSLSPLYSSSMLWKPVIYQGADRSIERTTLMTIYNLYNNLSLPQSTDQGIFNALYKVPYVSGFNISFGRAKDGFFTKSNYTFIQLTAGLDILEMDSIKKFISIALITSLALPCVVAFIALIFILKRRCSSPSLSSYDAIQD